jgi:molybdopterin-guanine dinucleotide biosynthesis protein A
MSPISLSAAILAGGQNRRMRGDKALLPLGKKPLIMHVAERAQQITPDVFVVAPENQRHKEIGLPYEFDRHAGVGPMAGLESALLALSKEALLLMACDMPFVDPALIQMLLDEWSPKHQVVAFRIDGTVHAMPALYRRDVLFAVERLLARKEYDIQKVLQEVRVKEIPEERVLKIDPDLKSFVNLNTLEAYRRYALEAEGKPPLSIP